MPVRSIRLLSWIPLFALFLAAFPAALRADEAEGVRQRVLLSDEPWQFFGATDKLPDIGTPEYDRAAWETVQVPHVFQTRTHPNDVTEGWYRCGVTPPAAMAGKRLYLVFEGAASIADVFVDGKPLGQHLGAYTRFVFDATDVLKPGGKGVLAVRVDNRPSRTAATGCLPSGSRLYKVWGGLYRKVWLVATDPLHVDPTDYASPGVYVTPTNVTDASADLSVRVLVRNAGQSAEDAEVRATLLDPSGARAATFSQKARVEPGQRAEVRLGGKVERPKLWQPKAASLYHTRVEVVRDGKVVDAVTEPTGFRAVVFADGKVTVNGKPVQLTGGDIHQEIESKASAMSDDDFRANYAMMQDLGVNWVRLPHYPHAKIEYDLCDELGILCWAENGHSNKEAPTPTGEAITTEMVKQNYNHPSIALWSVGNEASADTAQHMVPLVHALDPTRPVTVANMPCKNADFRCANTYPGWYGKGIGWGLQKAGYISETGAGGVVTVHCDYAAAKKAIDKYEPEEYQQLVAESIFQQALRENRATLGMFTWWCLRDFTDIKYKKPVGWNTKGLTTYAGDKKDAYYLYRCFLRPDEPTIHLASKRYFLRAGDPANGIKAYSNAKRLTLTLNGQQVSTLENGQYTQAEGHSVENVFFWPARLRTGRNEIAVADDAGHSDSAVFYFYGQGGLPEVPAKNPLVSGLSTTNEKNPAYYMDMPVQPQWPLYYDLDSTADNSWNTIPDALSGATWIAARRLTKPGQEAGMEFTVNRPATVSVVCTKTQAEPAFLTGAGFTESGPKDFVWRDNALNLVAAQVFSRPAAVGERIKLPTPDRDMVVLLKERAPTN